MVSNSPRAGPAPSLPLDEVFDFLRLLWAVDQGLQTRSKKMEALLGITGQQRFVLRLVERFPGIPSGQVADLLRIHPSTLTGLVKRLQRKGLLRRRSDPKDRRRASLGITARGRLLTGAQTQTPEHAVRLTLQRISPKQLVAARAVLTTLAAALTEPSDAKP